MPRNKEDKKQLIIHTAAKLFKKYGFEKTSLDDIAKALGKSRTSVYNYFKNKEELFIAQVENEVAPFFNELNNILLTKKTAIGKVKMFNAVRLRFLTENQKDYSMMNREIVSNPSLKTTLIKLTAEKEIKIMSAIIISGIKSGELKHLKTKEAKLASTVFHVAANALGENLFAKDDMKNFLPGCAILENMFIRFLSSYK